MPENEIPVGIDQVTKISQDYVKAAYTKMAQFALRPELFYDMVGGGERKPLTRRQKFRMWRRDLPRFYVKFCRPSNRWDDYGD